MAIDMFLKIDDIKGESVDSKHAGEIQISSFSWGMSQSGSTHVAAGSGSGKVNVQDLTVSKFVDSSTPTLMQFCANGKHLKQGVLTVRKAGGTPLEYYIIKFTDIIVAAITPSGSGGEDRLMESLTLNFGQFEVDYVPQKPDGSGGAAIQVTWNIPKNSAT
jgi:type VI secretion system secreted protein Hcp